MKPNRLLDLYAHAALPPPVPREPALDRLLAAGQQRCTTCTKPIRELATGSSDRMSYPRDLQEIPAAVCG